MTEHDQTDAHYWMGQALGLAQQAADQGEVPVGAVLVGETGLLGQGFNQSISRHDATAHAEVLALRDAGRRQQNYRLVNSTLYVTVEPCMMCAGALIHARITHLVYGTTEPKAGAVTSHALLNASWLNHGVQSQGGIRADECAALMTTFFRRRRAGAAIAP